MSERKVLNKYYPPDFDPSKIPRLRLPKDRQYTVRLMAPCNMRCKTCGEYIYKGKKFNARKETVQNEDYLGIKVFRFYIKCPRCLAEITFKTDPQNTDYIVEHGATRNFQALKLAEEQAAREAQEQEEEEKNNPMKLLENRTKASKQEMELYEALEELKDLNKRHANVDFEAMLQRQAKKQEDILKKQEEEDEAFVKEVFGKQETQTIKRLADEDSDDDDIGGPSKKKHQPSALWTNPSLVDHEQPLNEGENKKTWEKSIGTFSSSTKRNLNSLVRPKASTSAVNNNTTKSTADDKKPTPSVSTGQGEQSSTGLSLLGSYTDSESESDS